MHATAGRMEALLCEDSLSDDEAIKRVVGADVEVFLKAMETIDREFGSGLGCLAG